MLGMHGTAYANKAMVECDLVMSIGSRYDDRIVGQPHRFCKDAVRIHIDIDEAEIGKMIQCHHWCVGDAREIVEDLVQHVAPLNTSDWLKHWTGTRKSTPSSTRGRGGLKMQHVLDELYKLTGGDAIVSTDVGQHQMWAAPVLQDGLPLQLA